MVEVNPSSNLPASSSRFCKTAFVVCLVAVCSLVLIYPGDAPWIFDEPTLILNANTANTTPVSVLGINFPFGLAAEGLTGTHGVTYGPLPTWFYQMLLLISHDPVTLVIVRATLVTGLTAAALYWLSRALRLNPWIVPVIMLSPWLWFYSRQLWDNSLAIPICALLLAAYADFLQSRRAWSFRLALACCAVLPLIHLMALAMVVPVILHLLIFEIRWCLRFRWSILVAMLAFIIIPAAYWSSLSQALTDSSTQPPPARPAALHVLGAIFPLYGGHHLTGAGFGGVFGENWLSSIGPPLRLALQIAIGFSTIAVPAVWIGIGLAVFRAGKVIRRRAGVTALDHIATVALGVWLCQTLLDADQRIFQLPHYFNATWAVYAIFAWLAIGTIPWKRVARFLLALQGVSLGVVTIFLLMMIHRDGGNRQITYGATLANQMEISREIEAYSNKSTFRFDYPGWNNFPAAYLALRALDGAHPDDSLPREYLIVRYRDDFPSDARIELVRLPPGPASARAASPQP